MADNQEFWDRQRKSPFRWITSVVHLAMIYAGILVLIKTRPSHGRGGIFLFSIAYIFVTMIHELGHSTVAWALGFKFQAINIGPLTIRKDAYGHRHVHFDWNRIFGHGGYAAAVPVTEDHLRSNAIMMVFAGPFASLNAGMLCWLIYLKIPGTPWEADWAIPGILAVLFVADFVCNLIPIGYCDGTMLLHLILWTKHGQDLYALHLASKTHHDAASRQVNADYAGEVRLRRQALEQMLARNPAPSVHLGHSYLSFGYALTNHGQRREAAVNLQKAIEVFAKCRDIEPIHEANGWKGLAHVYRLDQNPQEAQRAATSALIAFDKAMEKNANRASTAAILMAKAHLNLDLRRYEDGLDNVREALPLVSPGADRITTCADLLRLRMRCNAGLGFAAEAKKDAVKAAEMLRSSEIPEKERQHAASALGSLAATVSICGVGDNAPDLFKESIALLEKNGPSSRALGLRIVLASVLRREGNLDEAEAALPRESDVEPERRRSFLEQRAHIYADTGRVDQAIVDDREALALVEKEAEPNPIGIAQAKANLAEHLLLAGHNDEAQTLAHAACDELVPRNHPDAAGPLVTLSLIRNDETSDPFIEHAFDLVRNAPLMESGSKAHAKERLEKRLKAKPVFATDPR